MMQQLLGFGRDLFLVIGSAFFTAFITWQIAKRKFSKANVMLVSAHMRAFTDQLRQERVR